MKTNWFEIQFESDAFNLKEVRDYFINPCCYGDDLGKWLAEKLKEQNVFFEGPDQEDWGWYLKGAINGRIHYLNISSMEDAWRMIIEPKRSLRELLLMKRNPLADPALLSALRKILEQSPEISNLQWDVP